MVRNLLVVALALTFTSTSLAQHTALIIDGQNNHSDWPKISVMMKQYLEDTGLFQVDVVRTRFTWRGDQQAMFLPLAGAGPSEDLPKPQQDPDFKPDFSKYDVVISNFGNSAADWPVETQQAFDRYVREGGGFVSVHAADNSFGNWPEYNRMIGLGGWGGRTKASGPYVFYDNAGRLVRDEDSPGGAGSHGPRHNIPIIVRRQDHPIMEGLPSYWVTAVDECYSKLRGPAENMTILATGKDASGKAPTDRHEPLLMVIQYGKGRVFHTTLGHDGTSCEGVDFITTLTRGTEWAATGKVTIPVPKDFPTPDKPSSRAFKLRDNP